MHFSLISSNYNTTSSYNTAISEHSLTAFIDCLSDLSCYDAYQFSFQFLSVIFPLVSIRYSMYLSAYRIVNIVLCQNVQLVGSC